MYEVALLRGLVDIGVMIDEDELAIALQEEEEAAAAQRRRRRRPRRCWTRGWILRRSQTGQYERLMDELQREDVQAYKNFLRMEPRMFREILDRVGPRIQRQDTFFRDALPAGLKLAVTLRHMAAGDSYASLQFAFRVSIPSISKFVPEVCQAILDEYSAEVMAVPKSKEDWKAKAQLFKTRWNFPHAVGALDGKHIRIKKPKNSGSVFRNYKKFFSIILFALVDADYKFVWVDVGVNGSASDGSIFNICELKKGIEAHTITLPDPDPLPSDDRDMPYFLIGDDAFPLRTWMMKPYSRRNLTKKENIFNYRLSRARRIVENGFGILANRNRFLLNCCEQTPETVTTMVLAACCLHNLMRTRFPTLQNQLVDREDANHDVIPGEWRQDAPMHDMEQYERGNRLTKMAKKQRDYLREYYSSDVGSVSWQDAMI